MTLLLGLYIGIGIGIWCYAVVQKGDTYTKTEKAFLFVALALIGLPLALFELVVND